MKAKETAFSLKRVFFTLHLWLGLGSGILFCLVCCTGFYLALHPQIEARLRASADAGNPLVATLPPEEIAARAARTAEFSRIEIPAQPGAAWRLRADKGNFYVDPHTGETLGPLLGNSYNWTKKLHRWLLLDSKVGRPITGAATIIYLLIMASGLYLWVAKSYRKLSRGLAFKRGVSWKRWFYDAHLVLGIYALIPLTIMASTGLWWSYREPYKAAVYWTLDGKAPPAPKPKEKEKEELPLQTALPYAALLETVHREIPFDGAVRIALPEVGETEVTVSKIRTPGFWRLPIKDELVLDIATADVVKRKPFAEKTRAEKFMSLIFDIHTGEAWGDITLIIYLLATLAGASLPISGTVMWYNRMMGQRRAQKILAQRRQPDKVEEAP